MKRTVSIPLWFDSNEMRAGQAQAKAVSFNSTLVRFKLRPIPEKDDKFTCFNSTLVRFKQESCAKAGNSSRVSIPLWFDSNKQKPKRRKKSDAVSIPLWFDSNEEQKALIIARAKGFNSTLVRFKPVAERGSRGDHPMFQFHSGSIQTAHACKNRHATLHVSIPLWFDSNGHAILKEEYKEE